MKRLAVLAMIAVMAMPVYAVDLDSMTVDELVQLEKEVHKKLIDSEEYPYQSFEDYRDKKEYHIGDTWEVPGLFAITIESAIKTDERDPDDDREPVAVYDIKYTYENIGWTAFEKGFNVTLGGVGSEGSIIDSDGEIGYDYGNYYWRNNGIEQRVPAGARTTATHAIGLNHDGQFKISFAVRGNKTDNHFATFVIDPE